MSFSKAMPIWIKEKIFQKSIISQELNKIVNKKINWDNKLLFSEHHLSHAASAFYPSPFKNAAILTMDGVGEWTTTSLAIGQSNKLDIVKEIHFPHSLGLLYSAFTYYAGFKVNSGEYKIMGLAPYGIAEYYDKIKDNLINIKDDGSFQLDMNYFDYCTGLKMTNNKFNKLFGGPPRKPESIISQKEMNLAASIQKVTEEVVIKLCANIQKETGQNNLCLAGGVALNCVANGALIKKKIFRNIWIQPASGDAGGAIGAALSIYYSMLNNPRIISEKDKMSGSYLGPEYKHDEILKSLKELKANYKEYNIGSLYEEVAGFLSVGKAVGWMQGKMEFGPRALGNRSIIADPRSPKMQKILNLKVKYRESFRPFAPSILFEDLNNWFDLKICSPYMLLVGNLIKEKKIKMTKEESKLFGIDKLNIERSTIPAVTHVDYSSRIQTVHKETNPKYHQLITNFKKITGCPILVNTSFNIRGEPIVQSVEDAFKCFMGTDLDILVIDNFVLKKENQNQNQFNDYKESFSLD
jgi:carbamoyltransferase